jgi:hypothetical protein
MDKLLFCGNAQVEIQGDHILRYMMLSQGQAKYQLPTRDGAIITILDSRPVGLQAVRRVFETGRLDGLLHRFNAPANIAITSCEEDNLRILISDSYDNAPHFKLWIAIGEQESLPDYPYYFHHSVRLDDHQMALLALQDISRPVQQHKSLTSAFFPQML